MHTARRVSEFLDKQLSVLAQVRNALADIQDIQKRNTDKNGTKNFIEFKVNDLVLLSTKNLTKHAISNLVARSRYQGTLVLSALRQRRTRRRTVSISLRVFGFPRPFTWEANTVWPWFSTQKWWTRYAKSTRRECSRLRCTSLFSNRASRSPMYLWSFGSKISTRTRKLSVSSVWRDSSEWIFKAN